MEEYLVKLEKKNRIMLWKLRTCNNKLSYPLLKKGIETLVGKKNFVISAKINFDMNFICCLYVKNKTLLDSGMCVFEIIIRIGHHCISIVCWCLQIISRH